MSELILSNKTIYKDYCWLVNTIKIYLFELKLNLLPNFIMILQISSLSVKIDIC